MTEEAGSARRSSAVRATLPVFAAAAVGIGLWLSIGPPRLTLLNAAIVIDRPWTQAAGAALAAAACLVPWRAVTHLAPRALLVAAALCLAFVGLDLARQRVEAGTRALSVRSALGTSSLPWSDVTRVKTGPDAVELFGRGDARVRVRTAGWTADQRASLERAIARRVNPREANRDP